MPGELWSRMRVQRRIRVPNDVDMLLNAGGVTLATAIAGWIILKIFEWTGH